MVTAERERIRLGCLKWYFLSGYRQVCTYPRRHNGPCEPLRRVQRRARDLQILTLLSDHDSVSGCVWCGQYARAVAAGQDPMQSVARRCWWAAELHCELFGWGLR